MMTYLDTLILTQPAREMRRPQPATTAQRIARLREWLATMGHLSFTEGYKAKAAELARLEAE